MTQLYRDFTPSYHFHRNRSLLGPSLDTEAVNAAGSVTTAEWRYRVDQLSNGYLAGGMAWPHQPGQLRLLSCCCRCPLNAIGRRMVLYVCLMLIQRRKVSEARTTAAVTAAAGDEVVRRASVRVWHSASAAAATAAGLPGIKVVDCDWSITKLGRLNLLKLQLLL